MISRLSRPFYLFLFLTAAFGILIPFSCLGGELSISSNMTITAGRNEFSAKIKIENRGNTSAYEVRALLGFLDKRLKSELIEQLPPNHPVDVTYSMKPEIPRGKFPAVLLIDYSDESGYPFSALSCGTFQTEPDIQSLIKLSTDNFIIEGKGGFFLNIENLSDKDLDLYIRLFLPREFDAENRSRKLLINARQKKTVDFTIQNMSALDNSSYAVFAAVEYDTDGLHHTSLKSAQAKIVKEKSWFHHTRVLWIIIGISLLIGIFLIILIKPGKKKSEKTGRSTQDQKSKNKGQKS